MRFPSIARFAAAASAVGTATAFSIAKTQSSSSQPWTMHLPRRPTTTALDSVAPAEREASSPELQSGRILEGGEVMDFSAVKASSRAESALAEARSQILKAGPAQEASALSSDDILGINDDVIGEVGHPLGQFATSAEIQDAAAWLRSQAKPGFFSPSFSNLDADERLTASSSSTATSTSRQKQILEKAYEEAGEVTGAYAKTFYLGTMLMAEDARRAIWAIYVWCRRTDEIVDAPRENPADMLNDLSLWELRLENLFNHGTVVDVYDLVLLDVLVKYPTLDITPFLDMIRGMLMDVPGLGQEIYDDFDTLHLYCYRVAGTVGLMSLPIFGCAEGYDEETSREPALSLGVAFQLTNILRDVGEDAAQRGRIYLPRDDMAKFGVTEEQIMARRVDENYIALMKFEIARARRYYARARRGVFMLAPESRWPVQSSLDAYGRILDKIEENGYDSLTTRAYVDKWEKFSILPFSWYRTLDASRWYPLPGDSTIPDLAKV